jgi:hypothetical protein
MATDPFSGAIAGVRIPDSHLAREAVALAREASSPMLFNHVMRSYFFAELCGEGASGARDREVMLLSAVLHDLGLTDHARGPRRFEIEGADAARAFASKHGLSDAKAWLVWDTIALHTYDLNMHKQIEARLVQQGILADIVGMGVDELGRDRVDAVVVAFPRLNCKQEFARLLMSEAEAKPQLPAFHPTTMFRHHCMGGVQIPDARPMIDGAPFDS